MWRWDAVDLAAAIAARRPSSREATVSCMERLGTIGPRINAVVEALADEALAAAGDALAANHPAERPRRAP